MSDSELEQLRQQVRAQVRRLDYAILQLDREAKFKNEARPEDRRFFRAYSVVTEVRDELRKVAGVIF